MEDIDFVCIDRLVKEYIEYRQSNQSLSWVDETDAIVERFMRCFDTGDYPSILQLWDSYVIQKLDNVDANIAHDADIAEFYMHIHCATCPFRQTFVSAKASPAAAAKAAARSMTIFKHFVESKGKSLVAMNSEFHDLKHLHRIAFPPTHPKYSHLFYEEWITRTRQSFFQFLIPFIRDNQLPSLCHRLSAQDKEPHKSTDDLLQRMKEKEKRTSKIAKNIFEAASDFADILAEDSKVDKDLIDDFQARLKEFGRDLLPQSPVETPSSTVKSTNSDASDSVFPGKKKKKKKKKANLDFNLIGCDVSSIVVELSSEISRHLQEGSNRGTASLSIDLEMTTQSSLQGCLLLKALRNAILSEEQKVAGSPNSHTIPESEVFDHPPSPRSKGGALDGIVSIMSQADILGIVVADANALSEVEYKASEKAESLQQNLPFVTLLNWFMKASAHVEVLPIVEEPNEEAAISREDRMLLETMHASRLFMEDYIALLALMTTTASGAAYVSSSPTGMSLYSKIVDLLLSLRPKKDDMMVKLHVSCLCLLLSICNSSSECLQTFVGMGGVPWLQSTLEGLYDSDASENLPGAESYLDLCVGLLRLVLRDEGCRKMLPEITDSVTILCAIGRLLTKSMISKVETGTKGREGQERKSEIPPEHLLIYLSVNDDVKGSIKESPEFLKLTDLVNSSESKNPSKLDYIRNVMKLVGGAADDKVDLSSTSLSDLVYSAGIKDLVSMMLSQLQESHEVVSYSEDTPSYASDNHILEKYRQGPIV